MKPCLRWTFIALVAATLLACDAALDKPPLVDPPLPPGKADVSEVVPIRGALAFDQAAEQEARDAFTHDLAFHGYTLAVRSGAVVALDITHAGSSSKLDTTLYVYGPMNDAGGFGAAAIAFDDDSGWGRLSRLRPLALDQGGTYLVVVGTRDGRGRGHYRLVASCLSAPCAPPPPAPVDGCHPLVAAAIEACIADWQADPDWDPARLSHANLIALCAEAEPVAPALDALCATSGAPADPCRLDAETFARTHLPPCRRALTDALLDATCVFGESYLDLFRSEALTILWSRVLTADSPLTGLEAEQVVLAARTTTHPVDTPAQAFAVVDQRQINQTALWDASARRAFVAYELGAGDNSFGLVFPHDGLSPAAAIHDGDLLDCRATWGPERRRCAASADCAPGLTCVGRPSGAPFGRCVDLSADDHPAIAAICVGADGCPAGAGLVCGGAVTHPDGEGLCLPAWMRAHFAAHPDRPVAPTATTQAQLLVHGLASVDVDATLDLWLEHPDPAALTVTLVNPAGNAIRLADPSWTGPEILVRDFPVRGLSGDEAVNGLWTLEVTDPTALGGHLHRFGLTITSRWD